MLGKRLFAVVLGSAAYARAQGMAPMHDMHDTHMQMNYAGMYLMDLATGTGMNPQSWKMPMIMLSMAKWHLMLMGTAFVVDTQQSGPRGSDKFYSPNWFMASASRDVGRGSFEIQTMLSLEPLTVTDRRYPELFQTGETAFGKPLIDAQHPHNFVMGLGVHYARPVGSTLLHFYYAPVGDPALGPVAFPHRASAAELPQATLGHHWQDSTHIATNVVTAAVKYRKLRIEASGFYGTEPGENRWKIEWGPVNSWSVRASLMPTRNWMLQGSTGHLVNPEREHPGDLQRTTASAHYTRHVAGGDWSSSAIWGLDHDEESGRNLNSFTFETLLPVAKRDIVTGRVEVVDKDELAVPGVHRIAVFTGGYTRDIAAFRYGVVGLGFNVTGYVTPRELHASYGDRPMGASVFLRMRLRRSE